MPPGDWLVALVGQHVTFKAAQLHRYSPCTLCGRRRRVHLIRAKIGFASDRDRNTGQGPELGEPATTVDAAASAPPPAVDALVARSDTITYRERTLTYQDP